MPEGGGATIWLTGLPAAGKTTLALATEQLLTERGRWVLRLDGDELRQGLCRDLGFSAEDRAENVRRAAHAARLIADAGMVSVVALVSPYAEARDAARAAHAELELDFLEVFVNTPVEECERRDPKGLYAKARAGEVEHFTGVDDPYEPPRSPDVELTDEDVETAVNRIWSVLEQRGLIPSS